MDFTLEIGRYKIGALQNFNGIEQSLDAAPRRSRTLPARQEPREDVLLGGNDFTPEAGESFSADLLENFGVAPLAMHAAGAELAFKQSRLRMETAKYLFNLGGR